MDSINFSILLLLGMGVFGGALGAWVFQKIRIPQVVGYIVIGILIGESGLRIVKHGDIVQLQSFNWFALGLIGFLVGGELKAETFRKYGKQFTAILLGEGLGAFFLVGAPVTAVVWYVTHSASASCAAGIVFGAIASATDPATTVEVLWEYRARGVLTTAIIAIVALDDALAMTLYGLGTSAAEMLTGAEVSIGKELLRIGYELFGSIIVGAAGGFVLILILSRIQAKKDRILAISIGLLLLVIGFSDAIGMDVILVTMAMGIILVNFAPQKSDELFSLVKSFSVPIYVMFFVLVGARLGLDRMPGWLWGIVILYVVGRSVGKIVGSYVGAKLSHAPRPVQLYMGLGLFAQGGVAIGLSIMASQHLSGIQVTEEMSLGDMIVFGVTATTMIVQLLGPSLVKLTIRWSDEINRNVTEEDIIDGLKVRDAMQKDVIPIRAHDKISTVFEMFSTYNFSVYPVVDAEHKIMGMLTLDHLKDILTDQSCWEWMVVEDVLLPAKEQIHSSSPLREALALMDELKIDQIPVVEDTEESKPVGVLNRRNAKIVVERELIKRRSMGEP